MISQLEASIGQHVSSIAELQETVTEWKAKFAAVKAGKTSSDSATVPSLGELSDEDLQALGLRDSGAETPDATISVDMRDTILRSQHAPGGKITTNC